MMYLGDDFSRDENLNGLAKLTPDQEKILDQMAEDIDLERIEQDAKNQAIENLIESGTLQSQDL